MKKSIIALLLFSSFFNGFAQEKIESEKAENKIVTVYWSKQSSIDIRIDELSDLVFLGEKNVQVKSFKLKIPGIPTHSINGNRLIDGVIRKIKGLKKEKTFMVFGANLCAEDVYGSKPVFFSIK